MGAHLDECSACQALAETILNDSDTLGEKLRVLIGSEQAAASTNDLTGGETNLASAPAAEPPGQQEIDSGVVFGRYRLLGMLGSGGMGFVCLAEHVELQTKCAIKFLPPNRAHDEKLIARFRREARAVGVNSHPNLVTALDAGTEHGQAFLVMEYVAGRDLRSLLAARSKLASPEVVDIAIQVATGLAELHRVGSIHRDIKPSNLLITRDGTVKIIDFGLVQNDGETAITESQQIVGSLSHMSPEQLRGGEELNETSDLYSLGSTLYTLLTGKLAYPGKTKLMLLSTPQGEPPNPCQVDASIPEELGRIIQQLMQPQMEARFNSCDELLAALQFLHEPNAAVAAAAELPAVLLKPLPSEFRQRIEHLTVASPVSAPQADRPRARAIWKWLIAAVATTLMAGIVFVTLSPQEVKIRTSLRPKKILIDGVEVRFDEITDQDAPEETTLRVRTRAGDHDLKLVFEGNEEQTVSIKVKRWHDNRVIAPELVVPKHAAPIEGNQLSNFQDDPPLPFIERDTSHISVAAREWGENEPFGRSALVQRPFKVGDYHTWSYETKWPRGIVNAIRTSPDNKRVALGSSDGAVRIFTLPDMEVERILLGQSNILGIRWVSNEMLLSSSEEGTVFLWDTEKGKLVRSWLNGGVPAFDADLSADGLFLYRTAVQNGTVKSNLDTGIEDSLRQSGNSYAVATHPNHPWVAAGHDSALAVYHDNEAIPKLQLNAGGRIRNLEFDRSGKKLLAIGESGDFGIVVDAQMGSILKELEFDPGEEYYGRRCCWSLSGRYMLIAHVTSFLIYDTISKKLSVIPHLFGPMGGVDWIDERTLLACSDIKSSLMTFRLDTQKVHVLGKHHFSRQTYLQQTRDGVFVGSGVSVFDIGKTIVASELPEQKRPLAISGVATIDGESRSRLVHYNWHAIAQVGESTSFHPLNALPGRVTRGIIPHPTRPELYLVYETGIVARWSPKHGFETIGQIGPLVELECFWHPDETHLLMMVADGGFWSFDIDKLGQEPVKQFQLPHGARTAAISPDGVFLATNASPSIKVYEMASRKLIAQLTGQKHWENHWIAFSPNGEFVAANTDTSIRIWRTSDWLSHRVIPVNGSVRYCRPAMWSTDSKSIWFASTDGVTRVYDVSTGEVRQTYLLLDSDQYAEFSPDGEIKQIEGLDDLVVIAEDDAGQHILSLDMVSQESSK